MAESLVHSIVGQLSGLDHPLFAPENVVTEVRGCLLLPRLSEYSRSGRIDPLPIGCQVLNRGGRDSGHDANDLVGGVVGGFGLSGVTRPRRLGHAVLAAERVIPVFGPN